MLNIFSFLRCLPLIRNSRGSRNPIRLKHLVFQKIIGINGKAYWPMHTSSTVVGVSNVFLGRDVAPGYMSGCYIQGIGSIKIGDYTEISGNVAIITANHDPLDLTRHIVKSVSIGSYCWIGFNAVILPGVVLGDHTIVAAGAIVTKSFSDGGVVIAGNPAKIIKRIEVNDSVLKNESYRYHGFLSESKFNLEFSNEI